MFSSWKLIGLKQLVVEYDQNPRSTSDDLEVFKLKDWQSDGWEQGKKRVLGFEVKRGGGMAISQPAKYSMVVMIGGSD